MEEYSKIKLTDEQIKNMKFVKLIFTNEKNKYRNYFEYKTNEINTEDNWNPNEEEYKMGGFNFTVEEKAIRWIIRGDTIFDIIIPEGTEVYDCWNKSTPHGVFRSNKIILTNPRIIDDEFTMKLYKKSTIPDTSYFPILVLCAHRGFMNTALKIYHEKVNEDTKELAIKEFKKFFEFGENDFNLNALNENSKLIYNLLISK